MSSLPPVRFGLTGLGGYAAFIADSLLDNQKSRNPSAELVAICDPEIDRFPARVASLQKKGVTVLKSFDDLMAEEVEAIWLPLPIDLHRNFTEKVLAAGKAVMCEKPAAGCVDDVDAMIAARDRANLPVAIGFQDIYEPAIPALKRRLVMGEFGQVKSVQVIACWPRSEAYFGRNDWAGRFGRNGVWIMDSPATNAMAHFLHLALFLVGPSVQESLTPTAVSAELYRANRIENYDTCSYCAMLPGDLPLHLVYTHACATTVEPRIVLETELATIKFISGLQIEITTESGSEIIQLSNESRANMIRTFQKWMRLGVDSAIGATLEMARAHTVTVNAASESSPIFDVPADEVEKLSTEDEIPLNAIRNIVPAMQAAHSRKCMLHETGMISWTQAAGTKEVDQYAHFRGPLMTREIEVSTHLPTQRHNKPVSAK